MKNKFFHKNNFIILLSIPLVLSIVIFLYNKILALVFLLLTVGLYFYLKNLEKNMQYKFQSYVENLEHDFTTITKDIIFDMPFPIVVIEDKKDIKWYNSEFKDLFEEDKLVGTSIKKLIPSFTNEKFEDEDRIKLVELNGRYYEFYFNNVLSKDDGKELTFLYAIDNTYDENIKGLFKDKALVIMTIYIDNYQDLRASTPDRDRPIVFAEIDKLVNDEFTTLGGMVRKYENDKYIAIIERSNFEIIYNSKFEILDKVREVVDDSSIQPTLSIGVGVHGDNPLEIYNDSSMAIDIALSRGGDQAVIKVEDNLEYFGGKSKAAEKTSKVKSRVISHALRRLIDSSSDVFIMGHENPDMDSFGSCLGIYEGVRSRDKKAYIVLNSVTPAIKNIYNKSINDLEELESFIKTEDEALNIIKPSSLIIIVDNHRRNSTEGPKLLSETEQIVIIDHHRRGADYIKDATISYIEPYASSASELVTEMLNYFDDDFEARSTVAEGLLAGITVDTKNFYYQTGVRTFEAASMLKRWGADSITIKQMFKDDFEIVRYKSEVISTSNIFMEEIAIGRFEREIDGSSLIASQAADDLLNIEGVKASFVLTLSNNKIHISGRSLGDISVQLIMEKIGGGGHLTAAATQIETSIDEAENILKNAIEEYYKEEEDEGNSD
ncbi:MAG: DHH family phosphoesterase [Tissierellia bacterium]|nr:DHH family phosphoesterase [Tissierellia bacterium]